MGQQQLYDFRIINNWLARWRSSGETSGNVSNDSIFNMAAADRQFESSAALNSTWPSPATDQQQIPAAPNDLAVLWYRLLPVHS